MRLLAIRDLNAEDPLPILGPKVERPVAPAADASKPTSTPGIFEKPDGKLETRIPENEKASGWPRPVRCPGKSMFNYFLQNESAWAKDFYEEFLNKPYTRVQDSFICEGTRTGRIPSAAPALGQPYVKPGSDLNGKRPRMIVLDDLAATDFSVHEERLIAAWYAKNKEPCK